MAREFVISVYLFFFKLVFSICKLFPLKEKVTFVVSFGDNSYYVYNALKKQPIDRKIVFLLKKKNPYYWRGIKETVLSFESLNIIHMFLSIYHLATSKYIFVDNYYGFLSVVSFKKNVQCIQLWHAAGTFKQFGLKDLSVQYRGKRAKRRFLKVYEKFHKVVVGSNEMAKVFIESFNLTPDRVLKTGVPRTDLFFDMKLQERIKKRLITRLPQIKNKKVILYAPTYRDGFLQDFQFQLDFRKLQDELSEEYIMFIKLHPAIRNHAKEVERQFNGFVYDFSDYHDVNELLIVSDVLISDYSSIPFEYSLLKRPMLFFVYDLAHYQKTRGLVANFTEEIPGPLVYNTDEMIQHIKQDCFDYLRIEEFSKKWNCYSNGNSSEKLMNHLFL